MACVLLDLVTGVQPEDLCTMGQLEVTKILALEYKLEYKLVPMHV